MEHSIILLSFAQTWIQWREKSVPLKQKKTHNEVVRKEIDEAYPPWEGLRSGIYGVQYLPGGKDAGVNHQEKNYHND